MHDSSNRVEIYGLKFWTKKYKYQVLTVTELKSSASKKTKTLTIDYLKHTVRAIRKSVKLEKKPVFVTILYALPPIPISDSDVS